MFSKGRISIRRQQSILASANHVSTAVMKHCPAAPIFLGLPPFCNALSGLRFFEILLMCGRTHDKSQPTCNIKACRAFNEKHRSALTCSPALAIFTIWASTCRTLVMPARTNACKYHIVYRYSNACGSRTFWGITLRVARHCGPFNPPLCGTGYSLVMVCQSLCLSVCHCSSLILEGLEPELSHARVRRTGSLFHCSDIEGPIRR